MNNSIRKIEVKYMAAGFIAIPGQLVISEESILFEPHGIDSIFLRKQIAFSLSDITCVKYHRILGILDGFSIETTDDRVVFSTSFGSDNDVRDFLRSLTPNQATADEGQFNLSERKLLQDWAANYLKRGSFMDLSVMLLLAIPAYSIVWLFARHLLAGLEWVDIGNFIFVVVNWVWILDIIVLVVIYSFKVLKAPVPASVKIYAICTLAVSGIVTVPLLHFSGRQYILRGPRKIQDGVRF